MTLHIRDLETDALVRKLAERKGVGLTEAVREAVRHELEWEGPPPSLWERTADFRVRLSANVEPAYTPDKAPYDDI